MRDEFAPEELRRHLANLAELQRIDTELHRLRLRLSGVPQRVEALRARLREEEARFAEFASRSEDHLRERRQCEQEIREREEKIRRLESQLFRVKTQREYDAIGVEIQTLREAVSAAEDRELALLDAEERHAAEERRRREALEALRASTEAEIARLEACEEEDQRSVETLLRDRPRFAAGLPLPILDRYEALRERNPETAVVTVTEARTCGGCQMQLVGQTLLTLDLGTHFALCEHCGRILLPPPSASARE